MKNCIFFVLLVFLSIRGFSQSVNAPLNQDYYHWIDRYEVKQGMLSPTFHSSFKPYTRERIAQFIDSLQTYPFDLSKSDQFNLQYLANDNWEWFDSIDNESETPIFNTFYRVKSDFYHVQEKDFDLHINPVLYLSAGKDFDDEVVPYVNTRGVQLRGMIAQKLGFYTYIGENQAVFPAYVRNWIDENEVVPHQGFWKPFKENGVDFLTARGYISFDVIQKYINLQFGYDKFRIGNGYRSLILSDFSNSYTFLKLNTKIWKINYTNLFTELRADAFGAAEDSLATSDFPRKFMSLHHLSVNIGKKLNVGLFEAIVFGRPDSTGRAQFELSYLNPIIFYRAIEHQNGSLDNAIIGLDFKWLPIPSYMLYGQVLLDEFLLDEIRSGEGWWANKYALQFGLKKVDFLNIPNLDLQLETNIIRPYTYGHSSIYTSYSHYRQPLAHPIGANLKEYLGILRYQPTPRLSFTGKLIHANYGADTLASNWGKDVLQSYVDREQEYGNEIGQGVNTDLYLTEFRASYQFKHNLFLDAKMLIRNESNELNQSNSLNMISFALRWNIAPLNYDY